MFGRRPGTKQSILCLLQISKQVRIGIKQNSLYMRDSCSHEATEITLRRLLLVRVVRYSFPL